MPASVAVVQAAQLLLLHLERGRRIDADILRTTMGTPAAARLALNELADARADLLAQLFPTIAVTRHDAAHIHDHLDPAVRPTVVLMNPPFSVAARVDGSVTDAALRHISSALARLADGGRLVTITGVHLSPNNPSWRDAFTKLQERGRVVFTAAIDGRVYAGHGTNADTRLTVIDRIPAEDPAAFPPSPGMGSDTATLLDWVTRLVPPRADCCAIGTRQPCVRACYSALTFASTSAARLRARCPRCGARAHGHRAHL
jgi:hypothetical protein